MNIPKNTTYDGIQEGVSFNLHLFTEKTTGGTFSVKTNVKNLNQEINKKLKQLLLRFSLNH